MSCVLRYVERNRPEILVVENVVEVTLWGPDRDGSTFAWWKRTLANMGYEIECLFLNSQFFPPCPQSRDRLYIIAWRSGNSRRNLHYRSRAFGFGHKVKFVGHKVKFVRHKMRILSVIK
jgi:DNA (cytosine-5)-methyltransferase 1